MKIFRLTAALLLFSLPAVAQERRPLQVDDIYNIKDVRDPQRSPDGRWVAYTVTTALKDTSASVRQQAAFALGQLAR